MKVKKPNQWMPLDIAAWVTKTRKLSPVERCAYMDLMIEYWDSQAPLEIDHDDFANIIGISRIEWDLISERVLRFFVIGEDGLLHNRRIDEELAKAIKISTRNQSNGAKGGRPQKAQEEPKNNPDGTQTEPKQNPNRTQTEPSAKHRAKHRKNTRACNGLQSAASDKVLVLEGDPEIEALICREERNWSKQPEVKKIRAEVREMKVRGIA